MDYDSWLEKQAQMLTAAEKQSQVAAEQKAAESASSSEPSEGDVVMEEDKVETEREIDEEMPEGASHGTY